MNIRPYKDDSDRSAIIKIMNQMNKHFNPEFPYLMDEEEMDLSLSDHNQTDLSRDFLIAEDDQDIPIGFTGLMKSSKRSWWSVQICATPEHVTTHLPGQLLDAIMTLCKDQSGWELRISLHASFSTLHEKFQSLGIRAVQYSWMLRLDDFKKLPPKVFLPSGIIIRNQKGSEDYPGYVIASNEAFREDFGFSPTSVEYIIQSDQYLQKTGSLFERIFAVDENQIVGFIIPGVSNDPERKDSGAINWLGVIPSYQHRGIGSALMNHGIQWLREKGCNIIELGVRADNEEALSLYKKFGFYELKAQKYVTYQVK